MYVVTVDQLVHLDVQDNLETHYECLSQNLTLHLIIQKHLTTTVVIPNHEKVLMDLFGHHVAQRKHPMID